MKNNNNITSVISRYYRKSANYDLELNIELKEIIIGLMLGDLFAEKRKPNSNTRLQFKQSVKNKEYIDHLYTIFKIYTNSEPKTYSSLDNRPGKNELNVSIKFWTLSLPCFNKFRELYYDDLGIKHIPVELEEIITARSLAYWAMDDGYKSTNGFYFCTESYTMEDNLKLSKILKFSVVLEFVKLQQLNLEGQILAQSIAIKTDKLHKNFRMIANKIVNRANIINPDKINYITNILSGNKQISNMTGITVKKAGRLSREALIPKKTVTIVQRGSLNRIHSDFLTKARYTAKNRRGIYSYTITIGHKCY